MTTFPKDHPNPAKTMTDLYTKSVCVVCSPLFISMAERLSRDFGKTFLFVPTSGTFITMDQGEVGSGIPGVEKVYSIDDEKLADVDLFVFPDIGFAETQLRLEEAGKRVWGARHGEDLEQQRELCKSLMEKEGLPVAPWKELTGMDALRTHLSAHKDQHVKINRWRGLTETFFSPNIEAVGSKLDHLQTDLGAFKDTAKFILEDDLPNRVEIGTDIYCIDGAYPASTLIGIEVKDLGYIAQFVKWDSIPEPLRRWNETMAPYLRRCGYRGFLSCEIRIGEDLVPYQIDACCRAGSPPSELYQEFYLNLAEILWEGAGGVVVNPKPAAKWAAQIVLKSTWANGHVQPVDFPEKYARNIKLFDYVVIEGRRYVLPLEKDVTEIGAVVGWGDTLEAAVAMVKEAGESIEGYGIKFNLGPLDKAKEQIEEIERIGVSPFVLEGGAAGE